MDALSYWEFQWWKALHLLRDGSEVPPQQERTIEEFDERDSREQLKWWKKASDQEILGDEGKESPGESQWKYRQRMDRARAEKQSNIKELEDRLRPVEKTLQEKRERRAVWDSLWRARTAGAVRAACKEWQSLLDSRSRYPGHILEFEPEFRRMKRDARFPRSAYADDSRIDYLSRGMAGLMLRVSPMTAIERLRNMKHAEGGPLWNGVLNQCECWRCSNRRFKQSLENDFREGKPLFIPIREFPDKEL